MKIIFSGGGTAGHVNPAIAAANYICRREASQVWLSGGAGNIEERLAAKAGLEIFTFPMSGLARSLSPKGLAHNVKAVSQMMQASRGCKDILCRIRPDIVVGTGGYASFPMVRAALQLGIKTALLEVNAYPGVATKQLASRVDCVMTGYQETKDMLPSCKRLVVTGSPVREEILEARHKRFPPLFDNTLPTVLSFWGSGGAKYMNEKMVEVFALAAKRREFNLYHGTGKAAMEWMPQAIRERGIDTERYDNIRLTEYIYDMDRCMVAADLVMCRGGGTLAEVCGAGKASLIIPSPFVAENHQEKNARILEKAGAAQVLPEKEIDGNVLYQAVRQLAGDSQRLMQMGQAALALSKPGALEAIYQALKSVIHSEASIT